MSTDELIYVNKKWNNTIGIGFGSTMKFHRLRASGWPALRGLAKSIGHAYGLGDTSDVNAIDYSYKMYTFKVFHIVWNGHISTASCINASQYRIRCELQLWMKKSAGGMQIGNENWICFDFFTYGEQVWENYETNRIFVWSRGHKAHQWISNTPVNNFFFKVFQISLVVYIENCVCNHMS